MVWNWEQSDWPAFRWDDTALAGLEREYPTGAGLILGAFRHLDEDGQNQLRVELLSEEAVRTCSIEGENLQRQSIQASLRRQLGLQADSSNIPASEQGIAELLLDVYETWADPLDHAMLYRWHRQLGKGWSSAEEVGSYRSGGDPMRVVSGAIHKPVIHFEAPPSNAVPTEMEAFITWFNRTAPDGSAPLRALARAGLTHIQFVSIHPFHDGNGRISRALSLKTLIQAVGQPVLLALSQAIERGRKAYYDALARNNKSMDVTDWLCYFARTVVDAQHDTVRQVDFVIQKGRMLSQFGAQLNERQRKAVLRVFREGPDGFEGGLSAGNYRSITGASSATTTRDLQHLVSLGILRREGEKKYARYFLVLEQPFDANRR